MSKPDALFLVFFTVVTIMVVYANGFVKDAGTFFGVLSIIANSFMIGHIFTREQKP